MTELSLRLLGDVALLTANGTRVQLPAGKVRAVLVYLAAEPGRSYSRAHLATLLWGDRPEKAARHSLSQALTTLRRTAGRIVVPVAGNPELLTLDSKRVAVDVAQFRALAAETTESSLARAAELFEGEPFAGLDVAEPDFEDWLASARAELRDTAAAVHERLLAETVSTDERDGEPMRIARRLLELDPTSEPAHRALVAGYAAQGQPARALRQYEDCRRRLRSELGVEPSEETRRLARTLQAERTPKMRAPDRFRDVRPVILVVAATQPNGTRDRQRVLQGLAGEIADELGRFRAFNAVLSGASVGADDATNSAAQLAMEQTADYVLTVSMRQEGRQPILETALVQSSEGAPIWAGDHQLDLAGLFDPGGVVAPAARHVERDWLRRAESKPIEDWGAYEHFLRGLDIYYCQWNDPEKWGSSVPHFEKAIELGSDLVQTRVRRDCMVAHPAIWPARGDERIDRQLEGFLDTGNRALALDPYEPDVHRMIGAVYLHQRRFEQAHSHLARGLRHNPNHPDLTVQFARYLNHIGEPERARILIKRAQRLNPIHPDWYWEQRALSLYLLGRYDDAVTALQRIRRPSFYEYCYLAACHAELDDAAAAERSVERALRDSPGLRLAAVKAFLPYRQDRVPDRILKRLAVAGMPA